MHPPQNWLVGDRPKEDRAKRWHHWFLDDDDDDDDDDGGSCAAPARLALARQTVHNGRPSGKKKGLRGSRGVTKTHQMASLLGAVSVGGGRVRGVYWVGQLALVGVSVGCMARVCWFGMHRRRGMRSSEEEEEEEEQKGGRYPAVLCALMTGRAGTKRAARSGSRTNRGRRPAQRRRRNKNKRKSRRRSGI